MDELHEDILENEFFKVLQTTYSKIFNEAERHCWLICVPQTRALDNLKITKDIIDHHVLKPSPLFRGVYVVHNNDDRSCEIIDNRIMTGNGFPQQRTVKILFEELFYNQEFKPYRVVCIEKPLHGGKGTIKALASSDQFTTLPNPCDLAQCLNYLYNFPENVIVLRKIDIKIAEFEDTYVLVKGYESDIFEKIRVIVEHAVEMLLCANIFFRKMQNNDRHYREIHFIIESYVMLSLYNKIFLGLRTLFEHEDMYLSKVMSYHKSGNTRSKLGISTQYAEISFKRASSKLIELNECKTPIQMLYLLQDVIEDGIIRTVENYFKAQGIELEGMEAITTDDLIPIIAFIISQSTYGHYQSTLFFIENFVYADISSTKLAFILINFRAGLTWLCEQASEVIMDQLPTRATISTPVPTTTTGATTTTLIATPPDSPLHTPMSPIKSFEPPNSPRDTTTTNGTHKLQNQRSLSQEIMRNFSIPQKLGSQNKATPAKANSTPVVSPSHVVSQPSLNTSGLRSSLSFQRAPEVINLVNNNQQSDVLSYLKSLQKL